MNGRRTAGVAVVVLGLLATAVRAENPAASMLNEPAPLFSLPDVLGGEEVSLEDLRGRIIVLHFAASW